MDRAEAINSINLSQQAAHDFLKDSDWIIITLGSSFSYRLSDIASIPTNGNLKKGGGGGQLSPGTCTMVQKTDAGN